MRPRGAPKTLGRETWYNATMTSLAGEAKKVLEKVPLPEDSALSTLQKAAARLYGAGFTRQEVARAMVDHLAPVSRHPDKDLRTRRQRARARLKAWEHKQEFRDFVWDEAMVETDVASGAILKGLRQAAERGRVDAAKLALEVTGRHRTREDQVSATQVNVVFGTDIPRPEVPHPLGPKDPKFLEAQKRVR